MLANPAAPTLCAIPELQPRQGALDALLTKDKGGDLGWFGPGIMDPDFEAAALKVDRYFGPHVYAALDRYQDFSKKMIIERILQENDLHGSELLVVGAEGGPAVLRDAEAGDWDATLEGLDRLQVAGGLELLGVAREVALAQARDPLEEEEGHLLRGGQHREDGQPRGLVDDPVQVEDGFGIRSVFGHETSLYYKPVLSTLDSGSCLNLPMRSIDLRSDTVTRPTKEMRAAMASADVGDDVLERDPTMAKLEGWVAELLGTEAALWVPSGCMGNLIALMLHLRRGDRFLAPAQAHVLGSELGTAAWLAGGMPEALAWEGGPGRPTPAQVTKAAGSNPFLTYAVVNDGASPGQRSGGSSGVDRGLQS